jgi:hypothetical protein
LIAVVCTTGQRPGAILVNMHDMSNQTIAGPVNDSAQLEYSMCPKCHTADAALTTAALAAGGGWQCQRCQHHWTSQRLATVAAYEAWANARLAVA